jgi:hypothetical protein
MPRHGATDAEPGGAVSRRDTPEDLPAVREPTPMLARLRGMETLDALYQLWLELKQEHAEARARHARERAKLDQQGSFLVGAVRAAGGLPPTPAAGEALAPAAGLNDFLRDAEAKLEATRRALEERIAQEEAEHAGAQAQLREQIVERATRFLEKPALRLLVRSAGTNRTILHLARVSRDESVLLLYLLTGKIPSRYDFLFDEWTEDVRLPPPPLYADEGVTTHEVRPGGQALRERVRGAGPVLPVKGFIPLWLPRPDGGEDFVRLLQRGPVMEAELLDGDAFRPLLTRDEAERLAGYLLRLKLEGRVELEIQAE